MEQKRKSSWSNIEPFCVLRMLGKNLWMILVTGATAFMIVFMLLNMVFLPDYTCSATFSVISRTNSSGSGLAYATTTAAEKFEQLLSNASLLQDAARELGTESFPAAVSSEVIKDSNLITMTVTADSPALAFECTEAILHCYPSYSRYLFDNVVMDVISVPQPNSVPAGLRTRQTILLLSGPAGALAMAAVLFMICISGNTVQTVSGARDQIDGDLVAVVQHEKKHRTLKAALQKKKVSLLISNPAISFYYTESVNHIRTRVEHSKRKSGNKVFLVASVGENEGKSTVAANLALALARKHKRVVLVDCDLRKPAQNLVFEQPLEPEQTLGALLQEPLEGDSLVKALIYRKTDNLFCLFSSSPRRSSANLLSSPQMHTILNVLKKNFDYVILDSPPMTFFSDCQILADLADRSLLVIRQDRVTDVMANDALDALEQSDCKPLGYVLNDMRTLASAGLLGLLDPKYGYGYGARYGYGYGYGKYGYGKYGYGKQEKKPEVKEDDHGTEE